MALPGTSPHHAHEPPVALQAPRRWLRGLRRGLRRGLLPQERVQDSTALSARNSQQARLVPPHGCFVRTSALLAQCSLPKRSCARLWHAPKTEFLPETQGTPRRRQLLAVTRDEDAVAALRATALQLRRLRT